MLAHFPTLYPDELLYSGIARYHLLSGNIAQKHTIQDLFDDQLVCATVDLPSHIKLLSEKIDNIYTVDSLIRNHTLFSYYESFLIKDRAKKIFSLMSKGSSWGDVHVSLGLTACLIKSPKYLKFCKDCYVEDISRYSEPYWHRAHQIPGVYICHLHKVFLTSTKVPCPSRDYKFEFVPLIQITLEQLHKVTLPPSWRENLVSIADYSAKLMNLDNAYIDVFQYYKAKLYSMGYVTPGGRFRFVHLIRNFLRFFTNDLLQFLNCSLSPEKNDTWIHKILRGQEIFHPLRHVLMHIFLDLDISEKNYLYTTHPFGNGPWPCLNKAAKHYQENVIDQCTVTRGSKSGKPVGTFSCNCGFIYSRTGPDKVSDDRNRIGRIKSFGHIWIAKLNQLNRQSLSLRAKAKLLGVDPCTVKNQTRLIGVIQTASRGDRLQELKLRRERFLKSLESARKDRVPVRHFNSKDYIWLYRHDRGWLQETLEPGIRKPVRSIIVDWNERDRTTLCEVQKAIKVIRNASKPQRITLAAIIRNLDKSIVPIALDKCLFKLSRTREYLDKEIETTEQFQIRRLNWAVDQLESKNLKVKGWKLLKLAGLNKPLMKGVDDELSNLISGEEVKYKSDNNY